MQASDGVVTAPARQPPDAGVNATPDMRLQRILKIVVVGLAIVLFAGLALVVGRVIYLASGRASQATQPAPPMLAIRPEQTLELPAGAQVRSVSMSGNRLAVHYEVGAASGIAVFDLQTGRKITNIAVEPKPAAR
jgi:Family of unknown function (DUF6476)